MGAPRQRSILRMERGSQQQQLHSPGFQRNRLRLVIAAAAAAVVLGGLAAVAPSAHASCAAPGNEIEAENCLPGTPQNQWDVSGTGDSSIQGFATEISVPQGGTVHFKIDTDAAAYQLEIYRMGYYGGDGARRVATVQHSGVQNQPACQGDGVDRPHRLRQLGRVRLVGGARRPRCRGSTSPSSSVRTAARATSSSSSATTTAARTCCSRRRTRPGRPTTSTAATASTSAARRGAPTRSPTTGRSPRAGPRRRGLGLQRRVPDGPLAGAQRLRRQLHRPASTPTPRRRAARAQGVPVGRARRVLVGRAARERRGGARRRASTSRSSAATRSSGRRAGRSIDAPDAGHLQGDARERQDRSDRRRWTGTWRDPRFSPPADGGRPENALTGTIFTVNAGPDARSQVPAADGKLRLWREHVRGAAAARRHRDARRRHPRLRVGRGPRQRLPAAPGWSACRPRPSAGVDEAAGLRLDLRRRARPPTTSRSTATRTAPGRDALVFGAGTVQWSWGLDADHDRGSSAPDAAMQQATVNLLADMGVQPGYAADRAGRRPAPRRTRQRPRRRSPSPAAGRDGRSSGAGDGHGHGRGRRRPGRRRRGLRRQRRDLAPGDRARDLELQLDADRAGPVTIRARAADDSGNLERLRRRASRSPSAGRSLPVLAVRPTTSERHRDRTTSRSRSASGSAPTRPGTITASATTRAPRTGPAATSDISGVPTARCWPRATSPASRRRLAAGRALAARCASTPARPTSPPTSRPTGPTRRTPTTSGPVRRRPTPCADSGDDGVFSYGGGFPTGPTISNYWADVVFVPDAATPPAVTAVSPAGGSTGVGVRGRR